MATVKGSSHPSEVTVWVHGLHGGFSKRESLGSKVHNRVAIVGDPIIFALIADVIGELKLVLNVLLQHPHVPVPVWPLLCVHHPKDMEQLVEQTSSAFIDTSWAVSKLVVALQNNLRLVGWDGSYRGTERGNLPGPCQTSCLRSLHLQMVTCDRSLLLDKAEASSPFDAFH